MVTVVKRWGNSIGVRLPKSLARELEIEEGSEVSVEARNGRIVISPLRRRRYRLAALVQGITPRNRHHAVETGKPQGKEVW